MVASFPMPAIAQETTWTLANSLRSVANPYHANLAKGGEEFAKSIGAKYEVLVTEGNSEKGIADIKALLRAHDGGKLILNVDPNDSPDARVIVEEVKKARRLRRYPWNKPDDLHPWIMTRTTSPTCPSNGVPTAEPSPTSCSRPSAAKAASWHWRLILSNVPAIERKLGLDNRHRQDQRQGAFAVSTSSPRTGTSRKAFEITQCLAHPLLRPGEGRVRRQ